MADYRLDPSGIRPVDPDGTRLPDGQYAAVVVGGVIVGFEPVVPASRLVPWTTTLSDGTPSEMWDDDDNLMMVEVPR